MGTQFAGWNATTLMRQNQVKGEISGLIGPAVGQNMGIHVSVPHVSVVGCTNIVNDGTIVSGKAVEFTGTIFSIVGGSTEFIYADFACNLAPTGDEHTIDLIFQKPISKSIQIVVKPSYDSNGRQNPVIVNVHTYDVYPNGGPIFHEIYVTPQNYTTIVRSGH